MGAWSLGSGGVEEEVLCFLGWAEGGGSWEKEPSKTW